MQDDNELMYIYEWVDSVPLSRPKKNISRDFADGVMIAELVKNQIPKIVEIHNYSAASSSTQKLYNWNTLNQKVFKKLGFQLSKKDIDYIINFQPMAVENVLKILHNKMQEYLSNELNNVNMNKSRENSRNESPQKNLKENMYRNNVNLINPNKNLNQNDIALLEYLKKQLDEKKDIISKLTSDLNSLEYQVKNSEETEARLNKRIRDLTEKVNHLGLH